MRSLTEVALGRLRGLGWWRVSVNSDFEWNLRFLVEFLELRPADDHSDDYGKAVVLDFCFLGFAEVEVQIATPRLHGRTLKASHSISGQAISTL